MIDVIEAAAELQAFCQSQDWQFCFIGGLALQRWGEPRLTLDADLTLLTGFGTEDRYIRLLVDRFDSRIADAAEFAIQRRVLLLRAGNGVGLDIALAGLPFEERSVQRSSIFEYPPGIPLRTCSAEDLMVLKAFAGRDRDWVDLEGIIVRQRERLDWNQIFEELSPLAELKDAPEIVDRLERRRAEFEQ